MKRTIYVSVLLVITFVIGCTHSHEPSETMKEVISLNTEMWKDLNELKIEVNANLKRATVYSGELDSLEMAERGERLIHLTSQKSKLKELDALIPELKGYEPKCSHEEGEPHSHNSVELAEIPESDLLQLHKELRAKLDQVKAALK